MRKKKEQKSLLQTKEKHSFNAFNVINLMLFMGVLSVFIITLGVCIADMVKSPNKSQFVMPIIERCAAIIVVFLPGIIRKIFKINFPKLATSLFYLFLFLSVFLGTFVDLYDKTKFWDVIVHAISGVMLGFMAMFFIKPLQEKKPLNAGFVFLFCFLFVMGIGACWEIYEFTFDAFLNLNMQKYATDAGLLLVCKQALLDTMVDMIANFIGAVISATICSFLSKNEKFVSSFVITKKEAEDDNNLQIEE